MSGAKLCKYYMNGYCGRGDSCNFGHEDPNDVRQPVLYGDPVPSKLRQPASATRYYTEHDFGGGAQAVPPDRSKFVWVKGENKSSVLSSDGAYAPLTCTIPSSPGDKRVVTSSPTPRMHSPNSHSPLSCTVSPSSGNKRVVTSSPTPAVSFSLKPEANSKKSGKALNKWSIAAPSKPVLSEEESEIYSKLEDLSVKDIQAFSDDEFELGNIPSMPPPTKYCF